MAKTSSHRLVFKKDRFLSLGDSVPCGTRDDLGARLPFGGRCMVDSIYHNEVEGQFVVTISYYPELKVATPYTMQAAPRIAATPVTKVKKARLAVR